MTLKRCDWAASNQLLSDYHDNEWGVPLHDDQKLFEFITLDAFQAGLSWLTILKKRESFRLAFDQFNPKLVASYSNDKIDQLMQDASIVRNRQKIEATIKNAQAYLRIQETYGSFNDYIWQFTNHTVIKNNWQNTSDVPAKSPEAEAMSKALKKEGFAFVGPTICYAFMQAIGQVNDHLIACHKHNS